MTQTEQTYLGWLDQLPDWLRAEMQRQRERLGPKSRATWDRVRLNDFHVNQANGTCYWSTIPNLRDRIQRSELTA